MTPKEKVIKDVADLLQIFIVHESLLPDITELIRNTGEQYRFYSLFYRRLTFLKDHGRRAHLLHEEFEKLDRDLYSMHLASKNFNIRILYSFRDDGTILLHAFYEREGKNKTDYTLPIPEALRRLRDMEE